MCLCSEFSVQKEDASEEAPEIETEGGCVIVGEGCVAVVVAR
jgi:hypothetical protein